MRPWGRVKVVRVTPDGAIAEVTSACSMVTRGDIAIRSSIGLFPVHALGAGPIRAPNGKLLEPSRRALITRRTSAGDASLYQPWHERRRCARSEFRIFTSCAKTGGLDAAADGPVRRSAELIVLSTEEKSSLVMVTKVIRQIKLGDGIEQE